MISDDYKKIITLIEQHSWRINSLISLIEHNESFYSKFPNTEQSEKANKDNEHYLKQIGVLNEELKKELNNLNKII